MEGVATNQDSMLSLAQPAYILRGHSAQVHAVSFWQQNIRLLSGDADGWVVNWSVILKRPVAAWRAHRGTILGLAGWEDDKVITHGRDNKLCVWQVRPSDEATLSAVLPIDDPPDQQPTPFVLHTLNVNALNFCSFALCHQLVSTAQNILVAVPGIQDGTVAITELPSEERYATVPEPNQTKTGMVMCVCLQHLNNQLLLAAGYESGHVAIFMHNSATRKWTNAYTSKAHTQPVLSLDSAPSLGSIYSSSADAIIARHPFPQESGEVRTVQTKHAGQQSLTVRSDEKIFATAGWDGRVRVYSAKTMKELAVLKWHKEGCYTLAFAFVGEDSKDSEGGQLVIKRDMTVAQQRERKARETHWLAAGSKDGKVSLWDIY